MHQDEAQALGTLVGDATAGTVSLAEGVHRAIYARSAAAAGPLTTAIHDGVADGVYVGLRGLFRGLGYLAGVGLSLAQEDSASRLKDSPAGALALGALSGMHGDRLHRDRSTLAVEMTLREHRSDVALDSSDLAGAFPELLAGRRPSHHP